MIIGNDASARVLVGRRELEIVKSDDESDDGRPGDGSAGEGRNSVRTRQQQQYGQTRRGNYHLRPVMMRS